MKVKIDTKEKFHIITVQEPVISAIMTEELKKISIPYLSQEIKNVVLNMAELSSLSLDAAKGLLDLQEEFYDNSSSFVICSLQPQVEKFLYENDLLEVMNITPTESEAYDIVQMEEIERELLDDEDE